MTPQIGAFLWFQNTVLHGCDMDVNFLISSGTSYLAGPRGWAAQEKKGLSSKSSSPSPRQRLLSQELLGSYLHAVRQTSGSTHQTPDTQQSPTRHPADTQQSPAYQSKRTMTVQKLDTFSLAWSRTRRIWRSSAWLVVPMDTDPLWQHLAMSFHFQLSSWLKSTQVLGDWHDNNLATSLLLV